MRASAGDPYGITAGPDGNLWFTDYTADKIGCMSDFLSRGQVCSNSTQCASGICDGGYWTAPAPALPPWGVWVMRALLLSVAGWFAVQERTRR